MLTQTVKINYKYGETIKIKPIGDVHLGTIYSDVQKFKKDLQETDESTYFLGIGDLLDAIISKDPRYQKHIDKTRTDATIDEQVDEATEILKPYKHRILGLGTGNHELTIIERHGTDPIRRICNRLGVLQLGYSGLLKIVLSENGARGRTIIVRYHHGWGGAGRTAGGAVTKYSKDMQYWDADIYLYGHDHQRDVKRIPRLGMSGNKLISKPKILCICGTYLKTCSTTINTPYGERAGFPPVELGGVTVGIKPTSQWVELSAAA